jgi:O-antigen ligase
VEIYHCQEKMVVNAVDNYFIVDRGAHHPRRHVGCPFHLYIILNNIMRIKVLETILVLVLAMLIWYYLGGQNRYVLMAGIVLAVIGAFIPALAEKIHVLWMKFGEALGFISGKIILTLIFFVFLVPIAWMAARFRKPVMKMKRNENSLFKSRNVTYTAKSMDDMW